MNGFSPIHSYVFGTVSVGLGLHALLRPRQEYTRFGLPLEPSGPSPTNTSPISKDTTGSSSGSSGDAGQASLSLSGEDGSASPLMYLKSTREASYGLALIALQYQGNSAGVTVVAGTMALAALGDGLVVWFHGGKRFRAKAWGHWGAAVGLGSWAVWRAFVAYGEWAAFHALN